MPADPNGRPSTLQRRAADREALIALFVDGVSWGWSAHQAGLRLKIDRPAASRLFQRCQRRGWVEHTGAWSLTSYGRVVIGAGAP